MVREVPDEVGEPDEQRNSAAQPDPGLGQSFPLARQDETHEHAEPEEKYPVLVFEADTGQQPEPEPKLLVAGLYDSQHDCRARRPNRRLERVHGQEVKKGEVAEGQEDRERGENLRVPATAEGAGHSAREPHRHRTRQCGKEAQAKKRLAGHPLLEPGDESDERRLVHVAPGQVLAAVNVVEFIAENAVAGGGRELSRQRHGGNVEDPRRAGSPAARGAVSRPGWRRDVQSGGHLERTRILPRRESVECLLASAK